MEKNLIPPPAYGLSRKYDFNLLKKYGDSVFIKYGKYPNSHSIRDAAYKYAEYNNIRIATRKEKDGVRAYHAGDRE